MKAIRFIVAATILVSIVSFKTDSKTEDSLLGIWIYADYDADHGTVSYAKVRAFKEDGAGIQFLSDGKLVKRQNVGWCGTPPIQYGNNDGTWKQTSDSTITISYTYWGGTAEEDWQILQSTDKKLIVKQLGYRRDGKNLRD